MACPAYTHTGLSTSIPVSLLEMNREGKSLNRDLLHRRGCQCSSLFPDNLLDSTGLRPWWWVLWKGTGAGGQCHPRAPLFKSWCTFPCRGDMAPQPKGEISEGKDKKIKVLVITKIRAKMWTLTEIFSNEQNRLWSRIRRQINRKYRTEKKLQHQSGRSSA